jgi:fructose-bisphosphate aldolase, class II
MPFIKDGRTLIRFAYQNGFALPAFNFCSLEMLQGCVDAAIALEAPILVQTYQADLSFASPRVMVGMVKVLAEESSVPIGLHLDHGVNQDIVLECLKAGYSSVMLDGGTLDFAALVKITRELAMVAHDYGSSLEVSAERFNLGESAPTNPLEALQLLEAGADMVACSVGSEHGQTSRLDLMLLEKIAQTLNAPLVLHGGSGIDQSDLIAAKNLGVTKVNIGSASYRALARVWRENSSGSHRAVYTEARAAICETAKHFIALLGADNAPAWREL